MLAEFRNLGGGSRSGWGLRESGAGWAGIGKEYPDEVVALFAGIAASVDAVDFQRLLGDERGDQLALAGVGVEPPAVVGTFDLSAVEVSAGKRHAAVPAGVPQSAGVGLLVASYQQALFQPEPL